MATPEFIGLRCDHCGGHLHHDFNGDVYSVIYMSQGDKPTLYHNHSEAYRAGREAGWYIAEVELCPEHAEAYAIEKASEESL